MIWILVWFGLFQLITLSTNASFVNNKCPNVCQSMACRAGVLTCPDGGLRSIPYDLPDGTTRVLLVGHKFDSTYLKYHNFSNYGRFQISKLTILNCSITDIEPGSFSLLDRLHTLDLSKNKIRQIEPFTFKGMKMHFLRLDKNRHIILRKHSFSGLSLNQLSLIGCGLSDLNYDSFSDLNGKLERLILTQNNLRIIDPRFSNLFRNLRELELNVNPLDCSCDMKWLTHVLSFRRNIDNGLVAGSQSQASKNIKNSYLSRAKCVSPVEVVDQLVSELTDENFVCEAPNLAGIDVSLYGNGLGARLQCLATMEGLVEWWSDGKIVGNPALNISTVWIKRKTVKDTIEQSTYICVARNRNGNTSAEIHLKWPIEMFDNNKNSSSNKDPTSKYPSLPPSISNMDSTLFRRQFTVLEMTGAVVGTFTVTLLIFLLIYRLILHSAHQRRHQRKRKLYETVLCSDSQTYDIPHNPPYYQYTSSPMSVNNTNNTNNNNNNNHNFPTQSLQHAYHQYPQSINTNTISPTHYLDFKNPPQIINNHLKTVI